MPRTNRRLRDGAAVAILGLMVSGASAPAWAAELLRSPRIAHHRPFRFGPPSGVRHGFRPLREPRLLGPPPPGKNLLPPLGGRSDEDEAGDTAPLPHGFALTVPMRDGGPGPRPAPLDRFVEVGPALAACWHPPAGTGWGAVTVRVAFRRNGTIYGLPRIIFVDAASIEAKASIRRSLAAALKSCRPLPFSSSLGAAVAGEIFAIRFVNQDRP